MENDERKEREKRDGKEVKCRRCTCTKIKFLKKKWKEEIKELKGRRTMGEGRGE